MAVDAFVLPYPGRSVGVVFWESRASGRRSTSRRPTLAGEAGKPEAFTVYAPEPLSPGELAELQACYAASLGSGLSEGPPVTTPLLCWWLGGLVAVVLLAIRSLEWGPGHAWLALAAAATALPAGVSGVSWPWRSRRVILARRLARRAAQLEAVAGTDPRAQERIADIWRLARRLHGSAVEQLRGLEAHCRDQAWLQAAGFYSHQRRAREQTRRGAGRLTGWLGGARANRPAYTVVEMRDR